MKFVKQEGFRLPVPRFRGRAFDVKNHVVAGIGEFVGTFLFLFFGYATQSMALQQAGYTGPDSTPSSLTVVIIAMGYGFSLLATAWVLYRVSGGLFNPAITLCLVISGVLSWRRGLVLFPCQILGGIVAAALVDCMLPSSIDITKTALAPGVSPAQGVFLEMFFTCELAVTVLFLAAEKSKVTFLAPLGIGLSLFVAEIGGVYWTGASLNPARSFGPCVASRSFESYHWIYWVGPCLGAVVSSGFYWLMTWLDYEEANPGQDSSGDEED